jgi:diguanylate cyclase (GGDEF)-like protein
MAQKLFDLSVRHKVSLSALMLDIDYFKKVNDTYGHDIGDEVLRRVAQTCERLMRATDLSVRYGGEEFCFLFPETNADGAFVIAEKLRNAIGGMEIEAADRTFSITASFGISQCEHKGDSLEQLIKRSDQALYEAKRKGRDRAVVWEGTHGEH